MKHLNAIVIAVSILISSLLIIWRMPRYQYFTTEESDGEKDGVVSGVGHEYVFDMVTGKLYGHTYSYATSVTTGKTAGDHNNWAEPKHRAIDVWAKRREIFGKKCTLDEWNQWAKEHNW